jgi:hypothetical protein
MDGKRPIDRVRDGAGQFEVGTPDDQSGVRGMHEVGGKLIAVKEKGIYEITFPDTIDPKRTNIHLPPAQRRIVKCGSDDEIVGRVFLTAVGLFQKKFLPDVDAEQAQVLALDCLTDMVAMRDALVALTAEQKRQEENFDPILGTKGALVLPSIPDIKVRVDGFLQKAKHAINNLGHIVKLFVGETVETKWLDSLLEQMERRFGTDHPFVKFLSGACPLLLMVWNARNVVEHPNDKNRHLEVHDYTLNANGEITPPTLALVHERSPIPQVAVSELMQHVVGQMGQIIEALYAYLVSLRLRSISGFQMEVRELPKGRGQYPTVRYGFAVQMGDEVVPFG